MTRIKYRYVVCFVSIQSTNSREPPGYPGCQLDDAVAMRTTEANLMHAIRKSVKLCHGAVGMGMCTARLRLLYWCPQSGLLVLRCLRSQLLPIHAALSMVTRLEIGGQERLALFDVHHVSGTIRGCQKFLVQFYTRQLYSNPHAEVRSSLLRLVQQQAITNTPPALADEA